MLNRRFLREKTLQNLYAFFQNGSEDVRLAERIMIAGARKHYELYMLLASIVTELRDYAQRRIDEGKNKHFPTELEKNPNMRFVQNRFIEQLSVDPTFVEQYARHCISWKGHEEIFRNLYQAMLNAPSYKAYMEDPESSYEKDKTFVCGFFKRKISNSSSLYHHFDNQSMYWASDFDHVAFWVLKSLKNSEENNPRILMTEDEFIVPEDLEFAKKLFELTALYSEEYTPIIEHYLTNWEIDRTPFIDVLIIKMAIAELCHFPNIPIKVTLNEYIEIDKQFSAEKSRIFVNGLLNKLAEDFVKEGKIKKSGRGLI